MEGTIYLIQPAELLGTNRYKVGCSAKNDLNRCKTGYKNGTRYLHIMACNEPFKIEAKVKELFKAKFSLIAGREYFEGDETEIKAEFYNIVNKYINTISNNITNTCPEKERFTCKICNSSFARFTIFKKHMTTKHISVSAEPSKVNHPNIESTNPSKVKSASKFTCELCGKPLTTKFNLQRHMETACNPDPEQLLKTLKPSPALSILTVLLKSGRLGLTINNTQNVTNNTNNGFIDNHVENHLTQNNNNLTLNQNYHINPVG
jgi:transposase-like protein